MDRPSVKVYVRKVTEDARTVSFQPPREIPQTEWLNRGFAIDGNSVITTVTEKTYVREGKIRPRVSKDELQSLGEALMDVEATLVEWLGKAGYDVEFA